MNRGSDAHHTLLGEVGRGSESGVGNSHSHSHSKRVVSLWQQRGLDNGAKLVSAIVGCRLAFSVWVQAAARVLGTWLRVGGGEGVTEGESMPQMPDTRTLAAE